MKSIALLFIILFSTLIIFYDPPAGYQEIRRLDSLAAKNSEVNVEWREFLKTNPSPTSSQIREIKSIIEEVAVLNESSVIIGKPLLSRKFRLCLILTFTVELDKKSTHESTKYDRRVPQPWRVSVSPTHQFRL